MTPTPYIAARVLNRVGWSIEGTRVRCNGRDVGTAQPATDNPDGPWLARRPNGEKRRLGLRIDEVLVAIDELTTLAAEAA